MSDVLYKQINSSISNQIRFKAFLPIFFFFEVLYLYKPMLNVKIFKPTKKGKKSVKKSKKKKKIRTKIIPVPISRKKRYDLIIKWLVDSINSRKEFSLGSRIINEFYDSLILKRGGTLKKKMQLSKLLTINRSNIHYRWDKSMF